MGNEEAEYRKLKGLLEALHRISVVGEAIGGEDELLHNAETAIVANKGNPQTLDNLDRNLRKARVRICLSCRVSSGASGRV